MTLADWAQGVDYGRKPSFAGAWMERPGLLDLAVLIVLSPLLLIVCAVIAGLIRLQDDGPVLFRQQRLGLNGEPFTCLKFRTMSCGAEAGLEALLQSNPRLHHQWTLARKLRFDPRATRLGQVLRRFSLDELPQVVNVLRGEMALVGPRPVVHGEHARYGRRFAAYASVKPGITGLWQVSGRNGVSYRRRVAMDVLYARRRTLRLDLWIVLHTLSAVVTGRGAS